MCEGKCLESEAKFYPLLLNKFEELNLHMQMFTSIQMHGMFLGAMKKLITFTEWIFYRKNLLRKDVERTCFINAKAPRDC